MITLVIGGSASGKSEYAEDLAVQTELKTKTYIATMQPFDNECKQRIVKHQNMRKNKGFTTLEQYTNLHKIKTTSDLILLECMGNLVANEMFGASLQGSELISHILNGVKSLEQQSHHLVIVTNDVFADGEQYDLSTMQYIENLAYINREIAAISNNVVELVFSIPIVHKGEKSCKK